MFTRQIARLLFSSSTFFVIMCVVSVDANESDSALHVKRGEQYQLSPEQRILNLDHLVLEDNSVLLLPAGVSSVFIRAKSVELGEKIQIIGNGVNGQAGAEGKSYNESTAKCAAPMSGESGKPGTDGGDAPNLNLDWELSAFGSLTIELTGGDAGAGGNGGDAQDADQSSGCPLHQGGDAGAGGASGKSGNGGTVSYSFRSNDDGVLALNAKERTVVLNKAGRLAAVGHSGRAGKGSAGRYVNKKTLTGNRAWVKGGDEGDVPAPAISGGIGRDGQAIFKIEQSMLSSQNTADRGVNTYAEADVAMSQDERINVLEKQLKVLVERIEALERR